MELKFARELPIPLTDPELITMGDDLAEKVEDDRRLQDREDKRRSEFNADKKERREEIQAVAHVLKGGTRQEDVECSATITESGLYQVARMDTGEIVEERPATDDDRARVLPFGSDREAAAASPAS